ncbi:Tyrosine--tRNA ligase, cytoplasmic [Lamellibrachia satsuma]|nr:Tyrosine--tRNA ligase, cytoplasmic [Lamellibrachia satsuma]
MEASGHGSEWAWKQVGMEASGYGSKWARKRVGKEASGQGSEWAWKQVGMEASGYGSEWARKRVGKETSGHGSNCSWKRVGMEANGQRSEWARKRVGKEASGHGSKWAWKQVGMEVSGYGSEWARKRTGKEVNGQGSEWVWKRVGMEASGHGSEWVWKRVGMEASGHGSEWAWKRVGMEASGYGSEWTRKRVGKEASGQGSKWVWKRVGKEASGYGSVWARKRVGKEASTIMYNNDPSCSNHTSHTLLPGLTGDKMSSSEEASKIDLLDSEAQVRKKVKGAFCEEGNISNNGVLAFVKYVILPLSKNHEFIVHRSEEFGGNATFTDFDELEKAFENKQVHPGDLKPAVIKYLNALLDPVRHKFDTPEMKDLVSRAYPPVNKKKGLKGSAASGGESELSPSMLDLRVGRINEVKVHAEASALYVEDVALGEVKTRTVVSGLAQHVPLDDLQGQLGVFLCNLKPRTIQGVMSQAMLLCAVREDPLKFERLEPPEGSVPGDRVYFDSHTMGEPEAELKPKKKIWEKLQVDLTASEDSTVEWSGHQMQTKLGPVTCQSLKNVPIK